MVKREKIVSKEWKEDKERRLSYERIDHIHLLDQSGKIVSTLQESLGLRG